MSDEKWLFEMSENVPDWEFWRTMKAASAIRICAVALNVSHQEDYRISQLESHTLTDKQKLYLEANNRLFLAIDSDIDINGGVIKTTRHAQDYFRINLSDFAEWAISKGIPLPEGFPGQKAAEKPSKKIKSRPNERYEALVKILKGLGCDPMDADAIAKVKKAAYEKGQSDYYKLFSIQYITFEDVWKEAKNKGFIGKK